MKTIGRLFKLALVLGVLVGSVLGWYAIQAARVDLPALSVGGSSVVYASDGKTPLGHISATGGGHDPLKTEQVSPLIRQAHMSAEDRDFYKHGAISLPGVVRALWSNAVSGAVAAGGSTITQQYVKNAYLTQEKTAERKAKEVVYAYRVEKDLSKDEILARYVNSNYYGRGAYGVDDAARVWFGVPATKLKDPRSPLQVARAAFLAALIQQPSYFATYEKGDPPSKLSHYDKLETRQRYVLDGLTKLSGVANPVSQAVVDKAKKLLPLKLSNSLKPSGRVADGDPYVVSYVRDWLVAWQTQVARQDGYGDKAAAQKGQSMAEAMLARGGMRIVTSINVDLQKQLKAAAEAEKPGQGLKNGTVIMDPRNGAVVAMYGGSSHDSDPYNYALYADRQVGSIMKTVVLADAVRSGISPLSVLPAPAYITMDGSRIYNDDRKSAPGCKLTLADAMAKSNNPVHIELITGRMASCQNPAKLEDIESNYPVTPKSVANLARQMGADDSLVPGKSNPAELPEVPTLALGVGSMNPVKVATIGSTFANGGTHIPPYLMAQITAIDGKTIYEHQSSATRVLTEHDAAVVNQTLTGVFAAGGTAADSQVPGHPMAGKTGTTRSDAWGLMYSAVDDDVPAYVCASWSGYKDNRRTGDDLWGATVMKICQHFFRQALDGQPRADFPSVSLADGRRIGLPPEEPRVVEEPSPSTEEASPTPTTSSPEPSISSESAEPSASESPETSLTPTFSVDPSDLSPEDTFDDAPPEPINDESSPQLE